MARPHKAGIDYFPLDTAFDDQIELLKLEFGSRAVGVLVSFYQKIYSCGYYTPWNEDILMLFARSACEEKDLIEMILEQALERGIFDRELFEKYGIITAAGIQQEYLRICRQSKRKQIVMVKDYCLVTDPDLLGAVTEMRVIGGQVLETPRPKGKSGEPEQVAGENKAKSAEADVDGASPGINNPAVKTALHLRDRVKENSPRAAVPGDDPKDPLLAKWANEFELLHRKGPPGAKISERRGYSWKEIVELIDYCQGDSFWAAHILTPADLRKKAVTLETKLRRLKANDNWNYGDVPKRDMAGKFRKYVG